MNRDQVLRKYAAEGERIYENRTAGDNTWLGFLVSFAMEFEVADDASHFADRDLLSEIVVSAWEASAITDEQHDRALRALGFMEDE